MHPRDYMLEQYRSQRDAAMALLRVLDSSRLASELALSINVEALRQHCWRKLMEIPK